MIKRALIPLDGSELAEQAIPHLLRFVIPERTELLLLTASPAHHIPLFGHTIRSFAPEHNIIPKAGEAGVQMGAVMQRLSEIGFNVSKQVLPGAPADNILQLAEKRCVDLIAMSTHGRQGISLALLGSVADEVVRKALPPVFLVPHCAVVKSEPSPRVILLPLDGTPLAETAIPVACHFAQITGAAIHLIRVIEPHDGEHESAIQQKSSGAAHEDACPIAQQASSYLERIKLRLSLAGTTSCCQIVEGEPADMIARIAHSENADLIVMSTHGRAGVERMIHGSVAGQVLSNAICPVLLMRGKVPVEVDESAANVVPTTSPC